MKEAHEHTAHAWHASEIVRKKEHKKKQQVANLGPKELANLGPKQKVILGRLKRNAWR